MSDDQGSLRKSAFEIFAANKRSYLAGTEAKDLEFSICRVEEYTIRLR